MRPSTINKILTAIILLLVGLSVTLPGQEDKFAHYFQDYRMNSGTYDGQTGLKAETFKAFSGVVDVPNAAWLRLLFGSVNLGEKSYLAITSPEDGGRQRLDSKSLAQWQNSSAFFNGNSVEIELYVAPKDKDIYFQIREAVVGIRRHKPPQEALCGNDNRVSTNDPAVGRFIYIDAGGDSTSKCTGWIVSNGAYLTAGHCANSYTLNVLEFNVPLSDPDGTTNFALPDDQYPVIQGSFLFSDNGLGNDWAVFDVSPNSNTGLLPQHAQNAFYRMSRDSNPATIRITGHGEDNGTANRTLQTDAGSSLGETFNNATNIYWEYTVDTRSGNSGSPIIVSGTNLTLGIHTHGGCNPPNYGNNGTSFENDNLENAVQTFPGDNVVYVDEEHTISMEDGTVMRPYDTVIEAAIAASSGGTVSLVTGGYDETIILSKPMTLVAPVGPVAIGTNTVPTRVRSKFDLEIASQGHKIKEGGQLTLVGSPSQTLEIDIPKEFNLSPNYPNPFNPTTTIKYALKEDVKVSLKIYNMLGQEVRNLVEEAQSAGFREVVWDGKNDLGQQVASGVYIYRIVAGNYTHTRRMVLLK